MFSLGDMSLSRVDEILQVLTLDLADLVRRIPVVQPVMTFFRERVMVDYCSAGFDKQSFTMVLAVRDWLFSGFKDLVRPAGENY